jgi:hypothetical protein
MSTDAAAAASPYPVRFDVEYPERLSRWKALLRLPLSIPVLVFSSLLQSGVAQAIWAAILVRGRIPRWLFEFQVALNRWQFRAGSYFLLLTDEYPPFEGDYPIRYDVQYPERPSRWRLVVWKFITSIPHFVILFFLAFSLVPVTLIAWFAILFTGRFPQGLHGYVAGILRWGARVQAYVLSLTDEFPPFSFSADAGPGGRNSYVFSSAIGVLAVGGVIGLFAALVILRPGDVVAEVSYDHLLAGELRPAETRVQVDSAEDQFESEAETGTVELTGAADPAGELVPLLVPQPGYRFVRFELNMENESYEDLDIEESDFRLKDEDGDSHRAVLVAVDGRVPPSEIDEGEAAAAGLIFELPVGVDPSELRFNMGHHVHRTVIYRFR